MRQCDLCGERGSRFDEVGGDAGDAGAGDCEGAEGEGGALGGEDGGEAEDWVSARLIESEIGFEGAGSS